jgi:hypothetical protein
MSPPRFTLEFKNEAVLQITERGCSFAEVSAALCDSCLAPGGFFAKAVEHINANCIAWVDLIEGICICAPILVGIDATGVPHAYHSMQSTNFTVITSGSCYLLKKQLLMRNPIISPISITMPLEIN